MPVGEFDGWVQVFDVDDRTVQRQRQLLRQLKRTYPNALACVWGPAYSGAF